MAYEYYFEVNTDDDKGVPFGPVNKDNLDIVRLIIDFTCWLDANESVTEISYLTIKANPALPLPSWQANYPLDETSTTPPVDTYPLVFVEQSVMHEGKAVVLDLAAGTPQLSYAVSFTAVAGLSRRRRLVDILMVIDKPLNSALVADGPSIPVYTYPLVIHTTTILPDNFVGRVYIHNDTVTPITVTLPPSPSMGDVVSFLDILGNVDDDSVTFYGAPGSSVFEGGASSVSISTAYEDIRFEWTGDFWEILRLSGDCVNVTDFGAVMNGVTSDVAAFQAAFDAAPAFSTVCVPAGHMNIDGFNPTSKFVLFKLDGTFNGAGTTPFTQIGASVVETFLQNGTKFYSKQSQGAPDFGPVLRVDQVLNHTAGPTGGCETMRVNCWVNSAYAGEFVPIGMACYVEDQRISAAFPESVALMATAARLHQGVGANLFGANVVVDDRSGGSSGYSGSCVGMELTVKANKLDDGLLADGYQVNTAVPISGANRIGIDIKYAHSNAGDGSPVDWSTFLNIGPGNPSEPNISGRNFIRLTGRATFSGINMRHLDVSAGHAIAMMSDQSIAWTPNLSTELPDHWNYFQHIKVGVSRFRFVHDTLELLSISDTGLLNIGVAPTDAATDAAAAAAGVPLGGVYRNGSVLMVRVV